MEAAEETAAAAAIQVEAAEEAAGAAAIQVEAAEEAAGGVSSMASGAGTCLEVLGRHSLEVQ